MLDNRTYILAKLSSKLNIELSNSVCKILFEDIPNIDVLPRDEIDEIIRRVFNDEPVQYITGVAPFYGYFFQVDNSVLIPRPETEELVYTVEKYIKHQNLKSPRILDIGTGSGCIPITLNKLFPDSKVTGIDVSDKAIKVAVSNNTKLESNVTFQMINFLDERDWKDLGAFDIILSNPPYIPHSEKELMTPNVLDNEPHLALFVENDDPLIFYRKIFEFAARQSKDLAIFLECNEYNAKEVALLFGQTYNSEIIKDLQGKDRIVVATSKNLPGKK